MIEHFNYKKEDQDDEKKALALTMAALTAAGMIAGCGSAPAAATPESAEGGAAAQQQEEQGQAAVSGEVVELTMWGGWSGDQIAQLEEQLEGLTVPRTGSASPIWPRIRWSRSC